MKFTLVILLFALFAINVCLASPSESDNGFGGALKEISSEIVETFEKNENDSGSNDEDLDQDDADEDNDKEDEAEEELEVGAGDAERKRRELSKITFRHVRDAVEHHTNIISGLSQAIDKLRRR